MPRGSLSGSLSRVLGDGQWHTFLEFYAATRDLIPPESALRSYRKHTNPGNRRLYIPKVSLDQQIEMGRRWRIHSSLHNFSAERCGTGAEAAYRLPGGRPVWKYDINRAEKRRKNERRLRDLRAAAAAGYLRQEETGAATTEPLHRTA